MDRIADQFIARGKRRIAGLDMDVEAEKDAIEKDRMIDMNERDLLAALLRSNTDTGLSPSQKLSDAAIRGRASRVLIYISQSN